MLWQTLCAKYRRWEDGYITLLDALNADAEVDAHWSGTAYRRLVLKTMRGMSPTERLQMRDFMWRYRGWRSWAWLLGIVVLNGLAGLALHLQFPQRVGALEAAAIVNIGVLGLLAGFVSIWFNPLRVARKRARVMLVIPALALAGALFGAATAGFARGQSFWQMLQTKGPAVALAGLALGIGYLAIVLAIVWLRQRELQALNDRLAAEAEQHRLAKQASESRLRLLQAQIEPHFLFNTLGAVQQLAEHRAPEAAALTANLIRFLRDSMGAFREQRATLGEELAIAESYLAIMRARLGPRLTVDVAVPEALRGHPLQPTLLLTFVENAVKHGIEPSPRGGRIRLHAEAASDALVLEVADTGVGMSDTPGAGHGLANAREQLALAYGGKARLELLENEPSGLLVRLSLPLELFR